jgi:uncharacterized membrane protein YccF (DUF307 family)
MAAVPPAERDKSMMRNGGKLLLLGVVLIVIGLALAIPLEHTAAGIGVAIVVIGCIPAVAGLALLGSGYVSRRSRAGKPFA